MVLGVNGMVSMGLMVFCFGWLYDCVFIVVFLFWFFDINGLFMCVLCGGCLEMVFLVFYFFLFGVLIVVWLSTLVFIMLIGGTLFYYLLSWRAGRLYRFKVRGIIWSICMEFARKGKS